MITLNCGGTPLLFTANNDTVGKLGKVEEEG